MDTLVGVIVGVSLAAACGFRVFVPMLVMSVSVKADLLQLTSGWEWVGSWPAIIAFSVATVIEVCAYYFPWLDNALDVVASPIAVVAGIVATAACISEMHPLLQWSAAIIAGGGAAGVVHATSVVVRGASTATTGGFGNFIVATLELIASFVLAVLAVVAPILAAIVFCGIGFFVVRYFVRRRARRALAKGTKTEIKVTSAPGLSKANG